MTTLEPQPSKHVNVDVPTITLTDCDDVANEEETNDSLLFCASSTNSSLTTSSDEDIKATDNEEMSECHRFMKSYVSQLFDSNKEITSYSKQTFGEFCQTSEGRQAFAKYVDNFRCHSLEVSETTFYNLAQSFALVLFECNEADDFLPAKSLMNMSFTYYHYPVGSALCYNHNFNQPFELNSQDMREFSSHLSGSEDEENKDVGFFSIKIKKQPKTNGALNNCTSKPKGEIDSPTDPDTSVWKSANSWFTKELAIYKQFFKDFPGKPKQTENQDQIKNEIKLTKDRAATSNCHLSSNVSHETDEAVETNDIHKAEKVYVYQALRYQPIWRSLRFWNAAFIDAVNAERQLHCSKSQWNSLTSEERENASEMLKNLTFAHLGSFIINMKHLGIGKETCLQFLKKQSVIGNLSKDLYQLLKTQIQKPLQVSQET